MDDNIIIKALDGDTLTVNVKGEISEIRNELAEIKRLMEKNALKTIQTADKIYNIENINEANFTNIIERTSRSKEFPQGLQLVDDIDWVDSFEDDLLDVIGEYNGDKLEVFGHFGWLVQDYLRKLITMDDDPDEEEQDEAQDKLVKVSYMVEAFHSSLRYMCYIQLAQLFQSKNASANPIVREFIHLSHEEIDQFDYQDLLINLTNLIPEADAFVPEIHTIIDKISQNIDDELYDTVLYLETYRNKLINGNIAKENAAQIFEEYLSALIFWLRQLVFLAKYKMVSIKDIDLNYRFGAPIYFDHLYGELHGFYKERLSQIDEEASAYDTLRLKEKYTYNRSVLLLKGNLRQIKSTDDYLSLSPLVIDYSVFSKADMGQTPEIYYYRGRAKNEFVFSKYNNELKFNDYEPRLQFENIASQNTDKPKLNQLYKHIGNIFKPFKTLKR